MTTSVQLLRHRITQLEYLRDRVLSVPLYDDPDPVIEGILEHVDRELGIAQYLMDDMVDSWTDLGEGQE